MVYVLRQNGQPLMPTVNHAKVRVLLNQRKAKVIKRCPFTIQLQYESTTHTQKINLGIDAGSKTIGVSATTETKVLYESEVALRNDIVELISGRRALRSSRRNRKTRYRKPRFDNRKRPDGSTIETFFPEVRKKYPDMIFMADCASYEDGMRAQKLGFDIVGTTLCGYTPDTKDTEIPCFPMLEKLAQDLTIPLIAEGGIWEPQQLQKAFACGAYAAVIGTAITRPREITKRFVNAITK